MATKAKGAVAASKAKVAVGSLKRQSTPKAAGTANDAVSAMPRAVPARVMDTRFQPGNTGVTRETRLRPSTMVKTPRTPMFGNASLTCQ